VLISYFISYIFFEKKTKNKTTTVFKPKSGGCDRFRTCDPCLAKAVLYQLSYAPIQSEIKLVGYGRFELPTSPLSTGRSNQLS
jgi:hypothetical protein